MNYKYLTGPFAGAIAGEGRILDVPFDQLDDDLKTRVTQFATDHGITDMEDAKERYRLPPTHTSFKYPLPLLHHLQRYPCTAPPPPHLQHH